MPLFGREMQKKRAPTTAFQSKISLFFRKKERKKGSFDPVFFFKRAVFFPFCPP